MRSSASRTVLRASLVLLAGGALAQALPLLLGPWLTRLYTPAEFGHFHLLMAVAANVAVVACARYEFALPLAQDDAQARALAALCRWLLWATTLACALAAHTRAALAAASWPLWLPCLVAVAALVSLATAWAMRAQRFQALAAARVVQHGGGALAQGVAGSLGAGLHGLILGAALASAAAAAMLWTRLRGWWRLPRSELVAVARQHRDFPLLNTPHAFAGALQDTVAMALIAAWLGPAAAGLWGLALRYLKAPATLVGGAVSQALYPALAAGGATVQGRRAVRHVMAALAGIALPLVALLLAFAPAAFEAAFGTPWRAAGELASALAVYIGMHFIASPLSVVTMAWGAQAWALKLALVGQVVFVAALAAGLALGGLTGAGWAVSGAMLLYFGWFFWRLARWPVVA
jgi:O-antigen/teichoic acid export membrane protein